MGFSGPLVFDSVSPPRLLLLLRLLRLLALLVTHPLSHTSLSHTLFHAHLCRTQLCHTPSFTHNSFTQLCHTRTHNFVTHHLSHRPLSHTTLSHNFLSHTAFFTRTIFHTQLCHTPSFAWQAWHLWTSTYALRGGRGASALGWLWRRAWSPLLARDPAALLHDRRGTFRHLYTVASRGRRGTWQHPPSLCVARVTLWHRLALVARLGPLGRL